MSKTSIKAIDAYCMLTNWDNALRNAFPEEVEGFTAHRDRALVQLRNALAKTAQDEFLRGRWGNTPMPRRLAQWNDMVARAAKES